GCPSRRGVRTTIWPSTPEYTGATGAGPGIGVGSTANWAARKRGVSNGAAGGRNHIISYGVPFDPTPSRRFARSRRPDAQPQFLHTPRVWKGGRRRSRRAGVRPGARRVRRRPVGATLAARRRRGRRSHVSSGRRRNGQAVARVRSRDRARL